MSCTSCGARLPFPGTCRFFCCQGDYKSEVYLLSQQLDEKVAILHLTALGATLDVPILEQAVSMSVKVFESTEVFSVPAETLDLSKSSWSRDRIHLLIASRISFDLRFWSGLILGVAFLHQPGVVAACICSGIGMKP